MPAEGRGQRPAASLAFAPDADHGPIFAEALTERLNGAQTRVEAVLARLTLSLAQVMQLTEGAVLPMPDAALNKISLEGLDGRRVGAGKLGQNRGMRAIRLSDRASGSGTEGAMEERLTSLTKSGVQSSANAGTGALGEFPPMDLPALNVPAMDAVGLSDFLATGTG